MLDQLARHGRFDLNVQCKGDVHIDDHHTVEDVAISLGDCFGKALGDRKGIVRWGHAYAPLDESLSRSVVDVSGRGNCHVPEVPTDRVLIKDLSTEMVPHFFESFAHAMKATVHVDVLKGKNAHHMVESMFKSFALALKMARRRASSTWVYACQKDEYAFSYACDVTCYRCTLLKSILKAVHKPLMPLSDTNGCSAGNAHTAAAQRAARSRNLRHTCGKQHTWETRYLFMVDVQEQTKGKGK